MGNKHTSYDIIRTDDVVNEITYGEIDQLTLQVLETNYVLEVPGACILNKGRIIQILHLKETYTVHD